jgi:hypothetical protein
MQIMLMALRRVCSQLRVALGIASCFSWSMSQSSELRAGSWQLAAGSWQLAALLQQARFPQIGVCAVRRGPQRLGGSVTRGTSLKNSKSAIKLLQVVLASAESVRAKQTHCGAKFRFEPAATTCAKASRQLAGPRGTY